ncbi:helicase RepA family protein [Chitinophagaceae bacterium LB-8]|uniref:Helicase RepA family protein n=1 Tax=Paraflavisolibacter caeni TaxID=2982496 RepID=A0A9X3B986_9BACT|nr:AAA family ATPase [Paraflavisolibacter caeni]MCU7551795.1 helicase RepA family protein [Paraflavisolibacter caeni]
METYNTGKSYRVVKKNTAYNRHTNESGKTTQENEGKEQSSASTESRVVYTGKDLLDMNIKEIPKLWDPLLQQKGLAGLTGSSDCGKSILLRQLAIAIATKQKTFLGYPLNVRFGRAICICSEDDAPGIAALLNKQAGHLERDCLKNLHFIFDCENLSERINKLLSIKKADLVVLDVWSDTFTGNPNNWAEVRNNLARLKRIADVHGCLIVLLHHTVKNSEKQAPDKSKLNGSQAIEAKLRSLLELRNGAVENERILYVLKNNSMSNKEKSNGLVLELNSQSLNFSFTGKKLSKSGENNNKTYDINIWMPLMIALRDEEGLSFENARKKLVEKHTEEEVPGLTWFKNNYKSFGGQSSTTEES